MKVACFWDACACAQIARAKNEEEGGDIKVHLEYALCEIMGGAKNVAQGHMDVIETKNLLAVWDTRHTIVVQ